MRLIPKVTLGKKKKSPKAFFFFSLNQHLSDFGRQGCSAVVLTSGLPLFSSALLPGLKLRHDRVLCAHDLESLIVPTEARAPPGGAEVGLAGRPAAVGDPGAADNPNSVS